MGFGTTLYTRIYFSHQTWTDKEEVKEKIEELQSWIENEKKEVMKWVFITEPEKFIRKDELEVGEGYDTYVENRVGEALDAIQEYTQEIQDLTLLYDMWDETHDPETGLAYDCPDDRRPYIWGDFIPTVSCPNREDVLVGNIRK